MQNKMAELQATTAPAPAQYRVRVAKFRDNMADPTSTNLVDQYPELSWV